MKFSIWPQTKNALTMHLCKLLCCVLRAAHSGHFQSGVEQGRTEVRSSEVERRYRAIKVTVRARWNESYRRCGCRHGWLCEKQSRTGR